MSCDGNRKKYLARLAANPVVAAACGGGTPDQVIAKLEAIYDAGVGGGTVNPGIADALTRAMFKEMQGMGITPPTHSADGLPNVRARQGYAALMRQVSTWRRVAAEAAAGGAPEAEGEPALSMAWRRGGGGGGVGGKVGIFVGGAEFQVQGANWDAMKDSVKEYAVSRGVPAKDAYDSTMKRWRLPGTVEDVQTWLDEKVPGAKALRPGEKLVTESPAVAAGVAAGILMPTPGGPPPPVPAPRSRRSAASAVTPARPTAAPVVPPAPEVPPDATAGPDPMAPARSPMSDPGELPPELLAPIRELMTGYHADNLMAFANGEPSVTAERVYPALRDLAEQIRRHYYGRPTDVPVALWARELTSSPAKAHAFVTAVLVAGGQPRCLECGYWVSPRYPHTCPSAEFHSDGYNARNRDKYGYSRWRTDQFGRPVSRKLLADAAKEFILPETDPMSNAEMEEHWGRVASAVASHDCRVKLRPGGFATDMKGTIYADPYPLGKDADPRYNLLVTKAGIYHEIGHELTTPPGHWKTILNIAKGKEKVEGIGRGGRKLITKMYNIVEDGRMERDMATRFPGVAETLAASCKVQPRWHERVGAGVPLADEVIWPLLYTALPFFKVRPEVRAAMTPEGRALFEELEPIARKGALGTPDDSLAAAIEITRRLEAAGVLAMPEGIEEHVTLPPPPGDDTEGAPIPPEAREDKRKKDKRKKKKSGEEGEKGGDSSSGGAGDERGEGGGGGAGGEGEESGGSSGGGSGGGSSSSDDEEEGEGGSGSSGDDDERNGRGKGWRKGLKERPDEEPKGREKKGDDDEESGDGAGGGDADDAESGGAGGGGSDADGDGGAGGTGDEEPKGREDAKKPRGGGGSAGGDDDEEGEGAAGGDAGEDRGDPWDNDDEESGGEAGGADPGLWDEDSDAGDEDGDGAGDSADGKAKGTGADGDDEADDDSGGADGDGAGGADGSDGDAAGDDGSEGEGEGGGSPSDGGSSKGGSAGEVDHEAASKATGPLKEGWEDASGGDGEGASGADGGELPDTLPDVDSLITPEKLDDILDTLEGEAVRAAERVATRQGTYEALGGTLHTPMGTTRTTSRIWDQGYRREAAPHDAVEQRYRTPDGRVVTYKTGFPMTTSSATLEGLKGREVQQREISGRLARQLESVRDEAEERIRFERRGRLDRRRYVAAVTGRDNVRSRVTDVPETGMAVSILLDQSGSMQEHIEGLRLYDATCIIGQALEQLDIGYEVRGHGGSSQQYKAMDDPKLDPRRAARLATDISQSNHVTAPVVGLATTSLLGADTSNRLIINLMDGDMEDDPELIPQYEATRKAGIVTFGIFLGNPNRTGMHGVTLAEKMDRYFGRNNWRAINDLSEMPKVVGRRIADIFDELQGDE